jgi:DNA-binding transcriptional MerR regulator/methylmalonyl-CoA mutase cobalamin-binding subunit
MTKTEQRALFSIGDVAEATGISPDTIRVWERRYGKPKPVRLPSGHRRYTEDHIRWLRRIAEALARGHRPGKVVRISDDELDEILGPEPPVVSVEEEVAALMRFVHDMQGDALADALRKAWEQLTPQQFLEERVSPFLVAVGEAWRDGVISIRHEHFVSEIVGDLLRVLRLGCPARRDSRLVLFTTLPDEEHGLGIQMAALLCATRGVRTRTLGTKTPIPEIVAAAEEANADAVALTVSLSSGGVENDRRLAELRKALPETIRLVVGGEGARGVRRGPRGIEFVDDLGAFERWIENHAA